MTIKRLSGDGRQTEKAIITLITIKYKAKPNTNIHNVNEKKAYTVMVNQKRVTTSHLKPLTTEHTKRPRHMALELQVGPEWRQS